MILPDFLLRRCHTVFLECDEFDTSETLPQIFALSKELRPFANGLSQARNKRDRVDMTIAYVLQQSGLGLTPPLLSLLTALYDRRYDGDFRKQRYGSACQNFPQLYQGR
jgi:hypothetical protein